MDQSVKFCTLMFIERNTQTDRQTDKVKMMLRQHNTTIINISHDMISRVQTLGGSINKPSKSI